MRIRTFVRGPAAAPPPPEGTSGAKSTNQKDSDIKGQLKIAQQLVILPPRRDSEEIKSKIKVQSEMV
jgi:hypothetical protein